MMARLVLSSPDTGYEALSPLGQMTALRHHRFTEFSEDLSLPIPPGFCMKLPTDIRLDRHLLNVWLSPELVWRGLQLQTVAIEEDNQVFLLVKNTIEEFVELPDLFPLAVVSTIA